jgi:hypothetical protein
MRITKVEVNRRLEVMLTFFRANPNATSKVFLTALSTGQLTGQPEKRISLKTVYEARALVRQEIAEKDAEQTLLSVYLEGKTPEETAKVAPSVRPGHVPDCEGCLSDPIGITEKAEDTGGPCPHRDPECYGPDGCLCGPL